MSQATVPTAIMKSPWAVGLYAFAAVLGLLFAPQGIEWFGPNGGQIFILVFLGAIGLWMISDLDHSLRMVLGNSLVFTIPALAIFSALWSIYPSVTINAALQLLPTLLAALLLGSTKQVESGVTGVFAAYFVYLVISLAFGRTLMAGTRGDMVFSGLGWGKNFFGNTAAYSMLLALAVSRFGWVRRNILLLAAGLLGLATAALALFMSKATGSLIGILIAATAFFFAVALGRVRPGSRLFLLLVLGVIAVPIILELDTLRTIIQDFVFTTFKKDATLTGRLYIWIQGDALIAEKPWLGYGYNAFWTRGNLDAETLWATNAIATRTGFNFHNQAREMLINLGWLGFIAIVLSVIPMVLNLFRRLLSAPKAVDALWLSLLIYTIVRMPVESVGPSPFAMDTLLFFAALTGPAVRLAPSWNQMPAARASSRVTYRAVPAGGGRARSLNT